MGLSIRGIERERERNHQKRLIAWDHKIDTFPRSLQWPSSLIYRNPICFLVDNILQNCVNTPLFTSFLLVFFVILHSPGAKCCLGLVERRLGCICYLVAVEEVSRWFERCWVSQVLVPGKGGFFRSSRGCLYNFGLLLEVKYCPFRCIWQDKCSLKELWTFFSIKIWFSGIRDF